MISASFRPSPRNFFDRLSVVEALGKARVKVLSNFGRLVRKRAQASLKYAKGTSSPGSPPLVHRTGTRKRTSKSTGKTRVHRVSPLREFLYYSYDEQSKSVVIGPERRGDTADPNAPANLERGGKATILDRGKKRSVSIGPRPFMAPALQAESPGFAGLWKDSIR